MSSVSVIVAYEDSLATDLVAEGLVDPDTVLDSDCEHGFESAKFSVEGQPHILAHTALRVGASVRIVRSGKIVFEGDIVTVNDGVSPHEVECSGTWDRLGRRKDYCLGVLESRYDRSVEISQNLYQDVWWLTFSRCVSVDTQGQILGILEPNSNGADGTGVYIHILDGMDPAANIARVTFDYTVAGTSMDLCCYVRAAPVIWSNTNYTNVATIYNNSGGSVNWSTPDGVTRQALLFQFAQNSWPSGANEAKIQIRDLRVYLNRTTAPRPDQIIAEIARPTDSSICLMSETEALGSAVTQYMVDPFATRAEAIEQARALYSGIMDVGVWEARTIHVRARPTSPSLSSRCLALTADDLADPDRDWGIMSDDESAIDAVCVSYAVLDDSGGLPDQTPQKVYYPSNPTSQAARVARLDLDEATDAEAAAAAQQVYTYTSQLMTGGVNLDADHLIERYGQAAVPNLDGALVPLEHLRAWDYWVMRVDAPDEASRGPWMISRCERGADGTLIEVGGDYWEHPGFVHPNQAGRYVAGHWRRTKRYREWRKLKARPKGKGWRWDKKRGKWWRWRWKRKWVEGYYK